LGACSPGVSSRVRVATLQIDWAASHNWRSLEPTIKLSRTNQRPVSPETLGSVKASKKAPCKVNKLLARSSCPGRSPGASPGPPPRDLLRSIRCNVVRGHWRDRLPPERHGPAMIDLMNNPRLSEDVAKPVTTAPVKDPAHKTVAAYLLTAWRRGCSKNAPGSRRLQTAS
jgi:hypothetical protein